MFGFKSKFGGAVNKYSGRKDFLEAVCASCALIAAADGDVSDAEVEKTVKVIASNPKLSGSFASREIELSADAMLKRAQAGRSGRVGLYKEIDDIASDPEMAETVYVAALDVAESSGGIDEKEKAVLLNIAQRLKIDTKQYDV